MFGSTTGCGTPLKDGIAQGNAQLERTSPPTPLPKMGEGSVTPSLQRRRNSRPARVIREDLSPNKISARGKMERAQNIPCTLPPMETFPEEHRADVGGALPPNPSDLLKEHSGDDAEHRHQE